MCRIAAALALWLSVALAAPAIADDPGPFVLQIVPLAGAPVELDFGDTPIDLRRLKIRLADGRWMRLVECATDLCAEIAQRRPTKPRLPEGAVPDTRVAKGSHPFVEVWLADAVERAGTGVLPVSRSGALVARDRVARVHSLGVPTGRAIGHTGPRLADLDGDGRDEVVVAMTREAEGAALVIITLRQDGLSIVAESEPERRGTWRDPIAVVDLDGDGGSEIATVTAGDDVGRLEIWRMAGNALDRVMSMKDFSSQIEGTRNAGMADIADMDGDGIADLIVPSADRRSLRVISLAGGEAAEPYRIALPAEAVTAIGAYVVEGRQRPVLAVGLADGTLALAR
jgi:hypothetical protein